MYDINAVDNRPGSDRDLRSNIAGKKKAMKVQDLMGYFGGLSDSAFLDEVKADILRMRDLEANTGL